MAPSTLRELSNLLAAKQSADQKANEVATKNTKSHKNFSCLLVLFVANQNVRLSRGCDRRHFTFFAVYLR